MKAAFVLAAALLLSYQNEATSSYDAYPSAPKPYKEPLCKEGIMNMYYGSKYDIPRGYQICDGSNGTPDIRNRFPMGSGKDFPYGTTGGARKIFLSISNASTST
jgi:hypothetical protein